MCSNAAAAVRTGKAAHAHEKAARARRAAQRVRAARRYGEFVLQCHKRDYTFKAADERKCQVIVHNLRQLRERWRAAQVASGLPTTPAGKGKKR